MQLTPSVYWPIIASGVVLYFVYSSSKGDGSYDTADGQPDSMPKWPGSQHMTGAGHRITKAQRLLVQPRYGTRFVASPDIHRLANAPMI